MDGKDSYSEVYMFSHRYLNATGMFVHITSTQGHEVQLTADHYLYVNGKLATAKTVRVGDIIVTANGEEDSVAHVDTVRNDGLYSPVTLSGDLVVSGIKTSCYTAAVAPTLAHMALWPARFAYSLGYDIINGAFDQGSELIASLTPRGKDKY